MGTNIHLHVEVFDMVLGRWEHFTHPEMPKGPYLMYEKMCGVRGEVSNAIAPPRGLPLNVSEMTQACFIFDDSQGAAQTPSWLSRAEVMTLQKFIEDELLPADRKWALEIDYWGYYFGNGYDVFKGPARWVDFRFVFWFDS